MVVGQQKAQVANAARSPQTTFTRPTMDDHVNPAAAQSLRGRATAMPRERAIAAIWQSA